MYHFMTGCRSLVFIAKYDNTNLFFLPALKSQLSKNPLSRHSKEWRHLNVSCTSFAGEVK